jgi:hypothetical protein
MQWFLETYENTQGLHMMWTIFLQAISLSLLFYCFTADIFAALSARLQARASLR